MFYNYKKVFSYYTVQWEFHKKRNGNSTKLLCVNNEAFYGTSVVFRQTFIQEN